jgi:hypothetical protein
MWGRFRECQRTHLTADQTKLVSAARGYMPRSFVAIEIPEHEGQAAGKPLTSWKMSEDISINNLVKFGQPRL